jgi:hypothetical protein
LATIGVIASATISEARSGAALLHRIQVYAGNYFPPRICTAPGFPIAIVADRAYG